MYRVSVDQTLCQGHARCFGLSPEVFGLDEDGRALVLPDADLVAEAYVVRRAAANCPEYAIVIEELDG